LPEITLLVVDKNNCFRYLSAETLMNRGTGGKLKAERGKRTLKCIE